MTPVQYQKQLRLFGALRLLASGETNVENAAFQVGYESASQFSREYSRMFGASPPDASDSERIVAILPRTPRQALYFLRNSPAGPANTVNLTSTKNT